MLQQSLGHVMKIHHIAQGFNPLGVETDYCTARRVVVTTPFAAVTTTWYMPGDKSPNSSWATFP